MHISSFLIVVALGAAGLVAWLVTRDTSIGSGGAGDLRAALSLLPTDMRTGEVEFRNPKASLDNEAITTNG